MEIVLRFLVILIIMCFVWVVRYKGQKQSMQFVLTYCAIVLFSSAISWKIIDLLPVPTEEVVVTALGEKNIAAKNNEIYLTKVFVNGKEIELKTATDDRWFWQGNIYVWRDDLSLSRPKNISDSFVLKLPLGKERYVEFYTNKYKGIVQVEYEENIQILDCYAATNGTLKAHINNPPIIRFAIQFTLQIVLFIVLFSSVFGITTLLLVPSRENRYLKALIEKWDSVILLFLSASTIYILFQVYPSSEHFYFDHIVTFGAALSENFEGVWEFLMQHPSVPPLPLLIEYFYFKIVPFGYNWIFLLPSICISLSVFLIGKFVSKYSSKTIGLVAAVVTLCSITFMEHGKDIRHYSFSILTTVFLIFFYVNYKYRLNKRAVVLFSVSMLMSAFCNYHSFILLLGVFLLDIVLNYKCLGRKILLPYFIAGLCFLPWAIIIFLRLIKQIGSWGSSSTWHSTLNYEFLKSTIYYISGENMLLVLLLVASLPIVTHWIKIKAIFSKENFIYSLCMYLLIFFFAVVILWAILNPENTLLNNRYFSIIIPLVSVVQCIVFYEYTKYVSSSNIILKYMLPMVILTIAFPNMMFRIVENQNFNPHGWLFFSDKITSDKEAYYQTSCVYTYIDILKHKGFIEDKRRALEYLLHKNRKHYPINSEILTVNNLDDIKNYNKVYIIDIPEKEVEYIMENGFVLEFRSGKLSILKKL